jgi:hypothetical protein
MIDEDIQKLVARDRSVELPALEADVWRREASLAANRRASRKLAAWQGVLMAVAVTGSAIAGFATTVQSTDAQPTSQLMPGWNLAPSALLLGPHR